MDDKVASPQTSIDPSSILLLDLAVEGDLPKDTEGDLTILAASEELVAQSLSEMKKILNLPFSEKEVR